MLIEIAKLNINDDTGVLCIYDARPKLNAQGNRFKGGGFEDIRFYKNSAIVFLDIDNIHSVAKSFHKFKQIQDTPEVFNSIKSYGPKVE